MFKYTIKKAFEKEFPNKIWRIEVNYKNELLAIETRSEYAPEAKVDILNFSGHQFYSIQETEKEWTLFAITPDYVLLKRTGQNSPMDPGLKCVPFNGSKAYTHPGIIPLEVRGNQVLVQQVGFHLSNSFSYFDVNSKELTISKEHLTPDNNHIITPEMIRGHSSTNQRDPVWKSKYDELEVSCFHKHKNGSYDLHIEVKKGVKTIYETAILEGLTKILLQPYFQINHRLFFLSENQRKLITYLL